MYNFFIRYLKGELYYDDKIMWIFVIGGLYVDLFKVEVLFR